MNRNLRSVKPTLVLVTFAVLLGAFAVPAATGASDTSCQSAGTGWNPGQSQTECELSCNPYDQVTVTASTSDSDATVSGDVKCGTAEGTCEAEGWCQGAATTDSPGAGTCEANTVGEWYGPDISASCTASGGADPGCNNCGVRDGNGPGPQTQDHTPSTGGASSGATPKSLPALHPGDLTPAGYAFVVQINVVGGIATAVDCEVGQLCVPALVTCTNDANLQCVTAF